MTGTLLVASFFLLRGWGDYQAWSDIRAFEQAVASEQGASVQAAAKVTKYSPEPDYSTWSSKRISDYHEGNAQRDDPPLAIMSITKLNLKVPVYNGTDEAILNRGVGRIIGTARMDGLGSLGIAGHSDGFFRGLKDLKQGELIELQPPHEHVRYPVTSFVIVNPTGVSLLSPTQ